LQENTLRVEIDEAVTENGFPSMIHAVDLEHILCNVQPNRFHLDGHSLPATTVANCCLPSWAIPGQNLSGR